MEQLGKVQYAPPSLHRVPSWAAADGRELGELFEYRIAQPVTIRNNESAMLPFLQQPVQSRKLLIYSDHSSQHPTNAAEITNSTGKTLDGGPITVYDGGVYAGEALVETVKTGDKRLISYAVDLGTRITEAFGSKAALVREVHAARGVHTTKLAAEETRTYTIRNIDQKAKTLILEHPVRYGYTLLNLKPAEKTSTNYRFEIPLAAGASQEFVVTEGADLRPDFLSHQHDAGPAGYLYREPQRVRCRAAATAAHRRPEGADRGERPRDRRGPSSRPANSTKKRIACGRNIESLNRVSGQQQQVQTYAPPVGHDEQQLAALTRPYGGVAEKEGRAAVRA